MVQVIDTSSPLHRVEMDRLRTTPGTVRDWLDANTSFQQRVLDQLRTDGPLTSRDIPDTADVPWKSTGWTHGRNVAQLCSYAKLDNLIGAHHV